MSIRIDELIINVDSPLRYIKGDTFTLDCIIDTDLTTYSIRCSIYDKDGNEVKLANANSGGSSSQIQMTDAENGQFLIICPKDNTDSFNFNAYIEIEIENSSGQVRTIYKEQIKLEDENLTWTTP